MREDLSDSSEDLYTLTGTTADLFDFSPNSYSTNVGNILPTQSVGIFARIFSLFKTFVFGLVSVFVEISRFSFAVIKYIQLKIVRLINFLDVSKDRLVDTLMWRRGLLFRPATHGGVIAVAAIAIVVGGLFSKGDVAAQDLTAQESVLRASNTAKTIVPTDRPRSEVLSYKVIGGDTLSTIADKYGVSTETIKWANNMSDSASIQPGADLKIPPVSGVVYQVKAGDTITSVAKSYSADAQTIADFPFNYIDDTLALTPGQTLYVPNGSVPAPVIAPKPAAPKFANTFVAGSGRLSWPIPRVINQYFSWYHPAIDIGGAYGTPIHAAASGTVIDSKKQTTSFGWYCIIDIGGGITVAYAHMSDLACGMGQHIERGQYIGAVGMTGRATGPHLHFEVRQNGNAINPLSLLN